MIEEVNQLRDSESNKQAFESVFLLKKTSERFSVSIEVDFSPMEVKSSSSISSPLKTVPLFYNDENCFTPSFILKVDQERYQQNVQLYRSIHNRKLEQISEQKSEIYVPKPSKNNSFCCICKTPFEDYLLHLNQPKHRYLLKKSEYYAKVIEICSLFEKEKDGKITPYPEKKRRGRVAKNKVIKKQIHLVKSISGKQTCGEQTPRTNKNNQIEL